MTHHFDDDLGRRLADLAEPAPALPPGVLPAVRQRAARQRQRQRGMVLATAVLVLLAGTGVGFARVVLPGTSGAEPVAEQPVSEPANGLLGWPVHMQIAVDVDDIASAWDHAAQTRHTEVRLLYAGPVGTTRVVVAEGLDRARRPRLAAFWLDSTRQQPAPPYRLIIGADVGFESGPPDHLVLEIPAFDPSIRSSNVLALTSPRSTQACRLRGGVADLALDPSTGFSTAAARPGRLRDALIDCSGSNRRPLKPVTSLPVNRMAAIVVHVAGP